MVTKGHIKNGVVVLEGGVRLREGLEVTVLVPDSSAERTEGKERHSVLDIPPVSVGEVLRPLMTEDDLLGEMLEGR